MHVLFYTRLFLYLLALSIPMFHPAIVVPYDTVGTLVWFLLMPGEMFIAYYLGPPRFSLKVWLGSALALVAAFMLLFAPFDSYALLAVAVGIGSFLLTALIFRIGQRAESVFFIEQFFLAYIYYKVLSFSRASESTAAAAAGITQFLLFLSIGAFLVHGIVLFLAVFPENRTKRGRKELYGLAAVIVPLLLVVAFILPPDFVSHSEVLNLLDNEADPEPIPVDADGDGVLDNGNLRPLRPDDAEGTEGGEDGQDGDRQGRRPRNRDGSSLEGVPSDQWESSGEGGGNDNQRAVMIVASPADPVYAADAYYGSFDPVRGFGLSRNEPLNELTYLRFLDTWTDREASTDLGREPVEIFYLSTIPERVTAYRPLEIEPTILTRRFHPFMYSYRTVSGISVSDIRDWIGIDGLSAQERGELSRYLEIPLDPEARDAFMGYLDSALEGANGYAERIQAILKSFSGHQYEIGFDEDVSVAKMRRFLFETMRGDCTEFSNAAAILARLAGIPSRVVTGYLASKGLQSDSHVRGAMMLQSAIDILQQYPIDQLYLVTTAHRHSWPQFYMPGYGWVDFESTSYAIPPPPGMDPNSARVVIPMLRDQSLRDRPAFPWGLALRILGILVMGTFAALYLYRFARGAYLLVLARGSDLKALRALSKLVLIRLAESGYSLKPPSRTLLEYSEELPELRRFAELYNRLRYREEFPEGMRETIWSDIRSETKAVNTQLLKKPGLKHRLRKLFSLKGLYY
jgi:hypothetical protein